MSMKNSGIIFNIQRFSLHDGPGIRTTVFLKGCNVHCAWCHNPESMRIDPQLSVIMSKCTLCGKCADVCPKGVHTITGEGVHTMKLEHCNLCGDCENTCPVGIISVIGRSYTANEVMEIIQKDKKYYENSGGGVTFSGGEPTFQYDFLVNLLQLTKDAGLHACLETNGLIERNKLLELCKYVDSFLYDFKVWDDVLHKTVVGCSNAGILDNLELLDSLKKQIILRCPIIPTINDKPEHFSTIKRLREQYPAIYQVELMPYHKTGISKWENIGMKYNLYDIQQPSKAEIERWNSMLLDFS